MYKYSHQTHKTFELGMFQPPVFKISLEMKRLKDSRTFMCTIFRRSTTSGQEPFQRLHLKVNGRVDNNKVQHLHPSIPNFTYFSVIHTPNLVSSIKNSSSILQRPRRGTWRREVGCNYLEYRVRPQTLHQLTVLHLTPVKNQRQSLELQKATSSTQTTFTPISINR